MNAGAPHIHACVVASLLPQLPISALAIDVTHIDCGRGGRARLAAIIDCHDREIVGYEFSLRGRGKEAERAVERFFCSLKEECVWQHNFRSFAEARQHVRSWIDHYYEERPHQSLGYLSPRQHRERQHVQLVA